MVVLVHMYVVRVTEFSASISQAYTLQTICTMYVRTYGWTYTSSTVSQHQGKKCL